jgi:trans-aconitate methyltransferase
MRLDASERPSPGVRERYRVLADLCRGGVLELGCGPGELCAAIAERGHEVEGVDRNREKIDRARERFPALRFTACDILEMQAAEPRADTVVLSEGRSRLPHP